MIARVPLAALFLLLASCDSASQGIADLGADLGSADLGTAPDRAVTDGSPADGSAPDAPACGAPTPFVPPGPPVGWKHTATSLLVVTQGPANHRGQDVVVSPGQPQLLVGKFAYGPFDKDLKSEDVEIHMQLEPPCGPWVLLGTQETSEEGEYGTQFGITDDGGRIFFTLPADKERPPGRYPVRMLVRGDHSMAAFSLFVVQPGAGAVVFDIDGTLTTDDFQLVSQMFSQLLNGTYVPKAYPDGAKVAEAWAAKGYLPVYLTGRPDTLRTVSQQWLVSQKAPPGAVHLTDTLTLPGAATATYKTAFLLKLQSAKVSLHAAYGNATSDIDAYAAAKIDKSRTYIIGPNAGQQGTVALTSYTAHLPTAQAMPAAAIPGPPDTRGW